MIQLLLEVLNTEFNYALSSALPDPQAMQNNFDIIDVANM